MPKVFIWFNVDKPMFVLYLSSERYQSCSTLLRSAASELVLLGLGLEHPGDYLELAEGVKVSGNSPKE